MPWRHDAGGESPYKAWTKRRPPREVYHRDWQCPTLDDIRGGVPFEVSGDDLDGLRPCKICTPATYDTRTCECGADIADGAECSFCAAMTLGGRA